MTLVVDVDFNTFKFLKREDLAFFWAETDKQFILVRPLPDMVARCVVNKTNQKSDDSFRRGPLASHTGKNVLGFTIDGVPMIKNKAEVDDPSVGVKVDDSVEEEEEVKEEDAAI